ncbi:MAG: alpha/beta hydrolase-fold protein [Anaerolineales bacterium]
MSLCTVHYRSPALGREAEMQIIVPDGPGPWPVLFMLHGLTGSYADYVRHHRVERLFRDESVLVVLPDGGRSFYCNEPWEGGIAWEDALWQDALGYVERVFPTMRCREKRAVMGLSMGGYGALLLGLRHPDLFGVCASVSGSTYFSHQPSDRHSADDVGRLGAALPDDNDLFILAERLAASGAPLTIRQSCGTEDHLWATNLAWHQHLLSLDIAHTWVAHAGAHDEGTWDQQVPAAARFCLDYLQGGEPCPSS